MSLFEVRDILSINKRKVYLYTNITIDSLVLPLAHAVRSFFNIDEKLHRENNLPFRALLTKMLYHGEIPNGEALAEFITKMTNGCVVVQFIPANGHIVNFTKLDLKNRASWVLSHHRMEPSGRYIRHDPYAGMIRKTRHYTVIDSNNRRTLGEHVKNCLLLMFANDDRVSITHLVDKVDFNGDWVRTLQHYFGEMLTIKKI